MSPGSPAIPQYALLATVRHDGDGRNSEPDTANCESSAGLELFQWYRNRSSVKRYLTVDRAGIWYWTIGRPTFCFTHRVVNPQKTTRTGHRRLRHQKQHQNRKSYIEEMPGEQPPELDRAQSVPDNPPPRAPVKGKDGSVLKRTPSKKKCNHNICGKQTTREMIFGANLSSKFMPISFLHIKFCQAGSVAQW